MLGLWARWRHVPQWWEDQDVVMIWYKDEVRRSWAFIGIQRGAVDFLYFDVKKHLKDYFRTNISHQKCLFKESYAIGLTRSAFSLAKVGCMTSISTVHISLFNAEVTKSVISLLRCLCSSSAWENLSHSDRFCYCWNKWGDSGPCEPYFLHWAHGHQRLGWILSRLAHDLSDAAFVFLPAFFVEGLVSKIPGWRLELGHSGISRITGSWATLIPSHIVPSGYWTKADAPFKRIDWGQAFFFLLVLGVLSNATPDGIHRSFWVL